MQQQQEAVRVQQLDASTTAKDIQDAVAGFVFATARGSKDSITKYRGVSSAGWNAVQEAGYTVASAATAITLVQTTEGSMVSTRARAE